MAVAPNSHKIVYEDSSVRILQVILNGLQTEPVHTHKWNSVMWFSSATPMTYYKYANTNGDLAISDSFPIPQMPEKVLNVGSFVEPEGPHSIKNMAEKQGIAYRVEFKNK